MTIHTVGIGHVKRDLAEWIKRVSVDGERIILTSRGKPQAVLVSLHDLHLLEQVGGAKSQRLAALENARALGEHIRAERQAEDVNSVELLHQLRRERDDELSPGCLRCSLPGPGRDPRLSLLNGR
ncbi:MAG TPA: type II toxin-antitoxin system Phd/YefM family antitoxin [Chloroflexi bacterium]|nr:type II toxin-antitoxin system Phd/YefM family antitoxin [Chloroflexota bacterium]